MANRRFEDLGIGSKAAESRVRLLNRDGSFNVRRKGLPFFAWFSGYHYLISLPWWKFNLLILLTYVTINAFFGAVYLAIGVSGLSGIEGHTVAEQYLQAIFFSTQTFTTVGFGRIAPVGTGANIAAAFESLAGLLSFAFATGLVWGRFSRPVAKIIFSSNAVIAPYERITGFMFRVANQRKNQLIDVEAEVTLSRLETSGDGKRARKFYPLDLERRTVTFFHLSWTVVHPIDEHSPLFGVTEEQLYGSEPEFLILLRAFDDTFSQTVHARTSYRTKEVVFGQKFKGIIQVGEDGMTEIELDKIHDHEGVE
ncbi:MAG TPA: ion channel [Candidatus Kapabacteria bacterium]|nr:ion channel [Candidatus Kapabacteria bacterium]